MSKYEIKRYFTDEGVKLLDIHMRALSRMWVEKQDTDFPLKVPMIFGMPIYNYNLIFENKMELLGRIKMLATLLNINTIEVKSGNTTTVLELK